MPSDSHGRVLRRVFWDRSSTTRINTSLEDRGNVVRLAKEDSTIQLLRQVSLFHHAERRDLEALSRAARRVYVKRRQFLFREGDQCTGLHVIVYGRIKISLVAWNGGDKPIQINGPGACFGDVTMFLEDPYYRNVQALDETLLLYIPRRSIMRLIEHDPRFALRLLGSLATKVRGLVQDIESFSLQPPAARLVTYLMRLLPPNAIGAERIDLSISKSVVAAHLNLTPETLSRYFRELAELGLVTVKGRTVLVHDVDRLGGYLSQRPGIAPTSPAKKAVGSSKWSVRIVNPSDP